MSHAVQGLICRAAANLLKRTAESVTVPLASSFVLMIEPDRDLDGDDGLPPAIADFAMAQSQSTPLAYVSTSYWGGDGEQTAASWSNGAVLTPLSTGGVGTINRALASIGCRAVAGQDEFDSIGLGWYRQHDNWIEFAANGKAAWQREPWPDAHRAWLDWQKSKR